MIFDLSELPGDFFDPTYDFCVAGGGVAGIVLAKELSKYGSVVLLEGGDLDYSFESQELYKGEVIGFPYYELDVTRLRFLGGSSNHWGGMCRPLDSIDFERKSYFPRSGWPFGKEELSPYLDEACQILGLKSWADEGKQLADSNENIRKIDFHFSEIPAGFRAYHFDDLLVRKQISTVLNANLVDIQLDENGRSVRSFSVKTYDFSRSARQLHARYFVLALGGIENPRMLLNANNQNPVGIGNDNDLVGRFFMEHPTFDIGTYFLTDFGRTALGPSGISYFSPTPMFIRDQEISNIHCRFYEIGDPVRRKRDEGKAKAAIRAEVCRREIWQDILSLLDADIWCPIPRNLNERIKKGEGLGLVMAGWEQIPNPDSRVNLLDITDEYGLRKAALDWRLTTAERHTVREFALEMGRYLARTDQGRLKILDWVLDGELPWPGLDTDEVAGNHHMGTTRMARDQSDGVVDSDCKIFGLENLYIAGSSVFPTVGHANPTLTIVQLALRLASHLAHNQV